MFVQEETSEIKQINQRILPIKLASRRQRDLLRLIANAKKAHELMNWKPKRSALKTMIITEWSWLQKLH